jgi:site-specific DNA-methyltransferase (adenine-specific)
VANFDIFEGDALETLRCLDDSTVYSCVTSPPYWKQRDYQHAGQLGQEKEPASFVAHLADIFAEVHRVTAPTGSCWVNIDDTYRKNELCGIPWLLVFAMKERGWHLRADVIWHKTSSVPESTKTRVTRVHEYLFHFVKDPNNYFYDAEAIREPHTNPWAIDCIQKFLANPYERRKDYNPFSKEERQAKGQKGITRADYGSMMNPNGKNKRTLWHETRFLRIKSTLKPDERTALFALFNSELVVESEVPANLKDRFEPVQLEFQSVLTLNNKEKFQGAHYAIFPQGLVTPCILSTCPEGEIVLDPFCGSGTTGIVSLKNKRKFIGIELVKASAELAQQRLKPYAEQIV